MIMNGKGEIEDKRKTRILLPKGEDYQLNDIFKVTTEPIMANKSRSILTLQIVFFPLAKASLSLTAWQITDFLKTLCRIVYCWLEEDNAGKHSAFGSSHWIFGLWGAEWAQVVRNSEKMRCVNELICVLEEARELFPWEFCELASLRKRWGKDWLKELIKGQNVEKIHFTRPASLSPLLEEELLQLD